MAYESKPIRRQKVRYDNANTATPLLYQLVEDGAKLTPSSATITIYAPNSTTALVTADSMTVSGTLLTYSVDTTTEASWPKGTGYRADMAITASSVVYTRHLIFDVVAYLLNLQIARDQLIALDDSVKAMEHDGDEDFSELIEACRDIMQVRIESKVLKGKKLIENAIIDDNALSVAGRFYVLARLFFEKGQAEKAKAYNEEFDRLFEQVLNSMQFDDDQDGFENGEIGGIQDTRLVM